MNRIITVHETEIRDQLGEPVRGTIEETLNALLNATIFGVVN